MSESHNTGEGRRIAWRFFAGSFFLKLHRDLGYVALVFVLGHVGILLLREPLLLEHLQPTAPAYMLAGLFAALLLALLVILSITRWRRRLWPSHRRFRAVHAVLAVACMALTCWHIVGSSFYLNTTLKLVVAGGIVSAIAAFYLRQRLGEYRKARGSHRIRDTARYSSRISYGALLLLTLAAFAVVALRLPV